MPDSRPSSRTRLLDAALTVIRSKGYAAARIEDVCAAAGLTRGSFFHHFKGKEDLATAAAEHWGATTSGLFAVAPYHAPDDPLDRLLAYVDFRKALLGRDLPQITCFAGTTVQEVYATHPAIRDACAATIAGHAATLVPDIEAAMAAYGHPDGWTAESLALHTQAVIQGAFVLAKALDDPKVAADSLDHLRRYITFLFDRKNPREQ